ncbi:hypothetical protein LTR09_004744 [Extremus antarcticus]|uniref:Uncharacterized protein n=1 Tax=Extremus antarcticus TaxID=702011 RepID=A0AAJ0DIE6_9PEZI|nr:hypothetical protein LTR09_004744 [Extremus antarcticus]
MAIPSSGIYDASKHAGLGLVRSTAQREDVQAAGISISCASLTKTPMTAIVAQERLAGIKSSEPADVAQAAAWIAANTQAEVNGTTVVVKGQEMFEVEASYRKWMLPLFAE